jgi:hypothetical protein
MTIGMETSTILNVFFKFNNLNSNFNHRPKYLSLLRYVAILPLHF